MAFNLKEYILFRTEIKRELFNQEVDTNFQMVSNPWVATRRYEKGNIVYHPVVLDTVTGGSGTTGEGEEFLTWWRANKRTTLGVFNLTQWDIIGGVGGFTNITIAGSKSYGKILANWDYPSAQVWDANFNGILEAVGPTDTIKFAAGPGISIAWNDADEAMLITNTGNLGEINNGDNIGTTSAQSVYDGMTGGYPQNDIKLKGLRATNGGDPALTVSTVTTGSEKDIVFEFDESEVELANISGGSPILNELSDIVYANLTSGDILYWNGTVWQNQPASAGMGNTIYTQSDTINNSTRVVGLNASPGGLSFRSNLNPFTGLYIDNTGKGFVFGENAIAPSGEYFRFNTNVDETSPYQMSLRNADTDGGSAMWFSSGGNASGFIAGMTNEVAQGSNYAINTGATFNGAANEDAFTIDQNKDLWVGNWRGNPAEIDDSDNERLIPFAKAKGTETGLTAVNTGLLFVDDDSGGTAKGSQGNALLINRRLSEFEPTQKVGLAVANTKSQLAMSTGKGQFAAIDASAYSFNDLQGTTEIASAFNGRVYDESTTANTASLVSLATIAYPGSIIAGPTLPITVGSLVQNVKVPTNEDGSMGHVSFLPKDHDIDMGLVSVNESVHAGRNVGVFSDVVNTYDHLNEVLYSSEFPNTETKWSGLFVGCVAIKKGGLYLEPQSTNPLCGGYTDTLWVSDVDNHIYFGNVDLVAASVTGSGTPNTLTKWTGTGSTLGDSLLQDDGTNLFIGSQETTVQFHTSNSTLPINLGLSNTYTLGDATALEMNIVSANTNDNYGIHVSSKNTGSGDAYGIYEDEGAFNLFTGPTAFGTATPSNANRVNIEYTGNNDLVQMNLASAGTNARTLLKAVHQSTVTGADVNGIEYTTLSTGDNTNTVMGLDINATSSGDGGQNIIGGQFSTSKIIGTSVDTAKTITSAVSAVSNGIIEDGYNFYSNGGQVASGGDVTGDMYHIFLNRHNYTNSTSTYGTMTANTWGIYQEGEKDKNYFAGKVGIGIEPTDVLDIVGSKGSLELLLDNDAGDEYNILSLKGSASDHIQLISIESTTPNVKLQAGIIGPLNTTTDVGLANDSFILASSESNNLNIINAAPNPVGTTTDNIAFYAGKTVGTNLSTVTPDLIILGSGTTKGNVGIGTDTPTEKLEIDGNTKISGTLNVGTVGTTASINNLGIDTNGNVVVGSTGGGGGGGGSLVPVKKSSDYTAVANDLVLVDTSATTNVVIKLPIPTTNGEIIGVKWIENTNLNDTPTVAGFNTATTIDGVDRSVANGSPLPLKSLMTYYEFIAYIVGDTKVWYIK